MLLVWTIAQPNGLLRHRRVHVQEKTLRSEGIKPTVNPKVSIVVPVYNVEKYLAACLESLITQTLKDIEILVINDGSTDSSLAIAQKFADTDSRIRIIDKQNEGYGKSMNRGFSEARGQYIGIVESDDCARANMFERLYEQANAHDADVVRSNYYTMAQNGTRFSVIDVLTLARAPYYKAIDTIDYPATILGSPAIWTGIYKRDFIREKNISFLETPGASYQDTGFILKVLFAAERLVLMREAFLNYRIDNEGSSVKSGAKVFCVSDEYASAEAFLKGLGSRSEAFTQILQAKKYETYLWNYNRLDESLRPGFLELMTKEFSEAKEKGWLDESLFSRVEWQELNEVIDSPECVLKKNLAVCAPALDMREHERTLKANGQLSALALIKSRVKSLLRNDGGFVVMGGEDGFAQAAGVSGHTSASSDQANPASSDQAKPAAGASVFESILSEQPLVSIVVPVYNTAAYLPTMLDSLLNQTYENLEIICVNDGSTDESLDVLEKYEAKDARIHIIDKPNEGAGCTRNAGLNAVSGAYMCFADSDDFLEPCAIERTLCAAKKNNADVVVFGLDQFNNEKDEFTPARWAVEPTHIPAGKVFRASEINHIYKYCIGFTVNKLYNTTFLKSLNLSFPKIGAHEDMPFTYIALSAANRVYFLDETLYHYRREREGSLSDTTNNHYRYMIDALICFREGLKERGLMDEYQRNFDNYALHMCIWKHGVLPRFERIEFRDACHEKLFDELGISGHDKAYFFERGEALFIEEVNNIDPIRRFVAKCTGFFMRKVA